MLKISSIQLMLRRLKPQYNPFVFHYPKTANIFRKMASQQPVRATGEPVAPL
jgi:hypothetical protein